MHHICICDQKSASHRISVSFVVPCSTEMGKKISLAEYRNRFIIIVFSKQKIIGGKKLYFFCLNKKDSLSSVIAALAFNVAVTAMQLCLANMLSLSQKKGDSDRGHLSAEAHTQTEQSSNNVFSSVPPNLSWF